MNFPDCLKIGPVTYRVFEVDDIQHRPEVRNEHGIVTQEEETTLGDISYQHAVIRLVRDQNPQMKTIHLMHEAVHGMLRGSGRVFEDADESLVVALSYAITALIRDNPALIALLWDNPDLMDYVTSNHHERSPAT